MRQLPGQQNGSHSDATALDRLVVASATFREIDTDRREALAARMEQVSRDLEDSVLLHTCHRVELISFGANGLGAWPGALRHAVGLDAAVRTFMVASGLDSAVVAEDQMLGQVRDAYRSALERGMAGPVTNELLRRSIRFAKRAQSFVQPAGDRSLADRALRWVDSQHRVPPRSAALVIGTGEMGRQLAAGLAARGMGVTVASRNLERAARLAASLPAPADHGVAPLSAVLAGPIRADVLAIAQRSVLASIAVRHVKRDRMLVVDLSSPGALQADAAAHLGSRLLNLDRLHQGHADSRLSPGAQQRLRREAGEEAQAFGAWLAGRASGDAIGRLRERAEEVRRRHVDRLRRRQRLDEAQAAEVEAMTVAMVGELLHEPTIRLRRHPEAASGVREEFGLE